MNSTLKDIPVVDDHLIERCNRDNGQSWVGVSQRRVAIVSRRSVVTIGSRGAAAVSAGESERQRIAGDLDAVTEQLHFRQIDNSLSARIVDYKNRRSRG